MEATTTTNTRNRKPLADRTNTTSFSSSNSITTRSLPKLPPTISNSKSTAAAEPVSSKSTNKIKENEKQQLLVGTSSIETRNTKRRKLADTNTASRSLDNDANKENVPAHHVNRTNFGILPDSSSPSTPSVRQPLYEPAEPLTVYARRPTAKKKGNKKFVNEAFTCLPVERKRYNSNKESVATISKCLTELPKKRRNKEHVASDDYFKQQRAHFVEIDKCELPEEEVSESELSDR